MRTLIYARYSSVFQNQRSIADQFAACRARAEREGWEVVECFSDQAISGAAGIEEGQRPGLAAMLARLDKGDIDQVLTESTDRLARHQGDDFAVREQIEAAGARLFTLMRGVVDEVTGTIDGLFAARTRKEMAHRVRRGQVGNIKEGRAANSVAYGYRRVPKLDEKGEPIRGLREIDEDKAAIVLRVFREYAADRSPRQIAADLNAEGIPAPRGGIWTAGTLLSKRRDSFGILSNPIYIGRMVYGRTRAKVDPRTRRRSFVTSDGERVVADVPHLRIVSDELWQAVQDQIIARSVPHPERQRRPRHLLSRLGQCGVCGGTWIVTRDDYFGCGRHLLGKACTNHRLIKKHEYERRVLADLKAQMLAPDVVETYLDEYRKEHARKARETARSRGQFERRKAEAARKVERLVAAIAAGGAEFGEIRAALATAKAELADAEKALAATDAMPRLALHPGLARQYRRAIEELERELADEHTRREAAPKIRSLIARVIVTPSAGKRGVDLEVVRHIDEVMNLASAADVPRRRTA